ncbi:Ankyrin repeat and zinc finger domain-containing protein 1 [Bagarius yarrelli]|uniref:Ankyrin repeat and zinc finger domain-containing protein 1 n=1 Tax=Bagarius yarrelli TaxID=175774 RepID=A0A556UZ72_BAGYA|nr:Ankyrin repeat and zinc finger domain-containing protein 1 [Bagarius yarrelli]
MMARPNRCSLFDLVADPKLNDGLREILHLQNHPESLNLAIGAEFSDDKRGSDSRRDEPVPFGEVSDKRSCSTCQCSFERREEQMEHYKLDWHRFNLRQRLAGRSPITVEEFEKKTGMGDVSSISGSDSEDESNSEEDSGGGGGGGGGNGAILYGGRLPSRVLLQNSQGQYFSLYRCAVQKITDIQELLKSWAEYLAQADAIFLRSPKYNRSVFFGGREAPLEKKDSRIRSIPFATRRATFREISRVHDVLSMLQIYDQTTDISSILNSTKKMWQKKKSNSAIQNSAVPVDHQQAEQEEEEEDEVSVQLYTDDVTLTTLDLREHEIKPSKKKRKKRKGKLIEREGVIHPTEIKHDDEDELCASWEFSIRDALYTACKTGDVEGLRALLMQDTDMLTQLLNTPIDLDGYTLLHVASAAAQKCVVNLLLEMGSDPTCRLQKNMFRKFMADHPDKYDYAKAQVPGPLTAEIESKKAEKKKAQRAAKKQREKEQREEKQREEEEQEERRRFLALTDREKRALAAERRLAEQVATTGGTVTNIRRCWQCGESLLGKVPFEYLNYYFCSTRCVQIHRKSNCAAKP